MTGSETFDKENVIAVIARPPLFEIEVIWRLQYNKGINARSYLEFYQTMEDDNDERGVLKPSKVSALRFLNPLC